MSRDVPTSSLSVGTPEAAPETTPATSNAAWELATPVYERYNILTTKCSYRSGQLERPLLLWFNGNVSVHAPLNQTYQFDVLGCARTTVVSDSSRTNWNISMTLDCDHVQLQCGMIKANGDAELSNLVDFTRLESEAAVIVASSCLVLQCMPIHNHTSR